MAERPRHVPAGADKLRTDTVKVWDAGVRLFHWMLVAAVLTSGITGFFGAPNTLGIHLVAGGAIAFLVGARVIWGVLGGGTARFSSFLFAPRVTLDHVGGLWRGTARRYLGHNPLGGLMVVALLAVLCLIVASGVVTLGGQDKQGPLAFAVPFAVGWSARGVHKLLALGLVAMIAAHLGGVLLESLRERENLTAAMVTGRKRPEPGSLPAPGAGAPWLAVGMILIASLACAGGVTLLSAKPALGVPGPVTDADVLRECGACHMVYHPSLVPAASWQAILGGLSHHFSADASLDPTLSTSIGRYLAANSAEHWDTLPAVMLRESVDPKDPRRITATGFWQRRHRRIPDSVFAAPTIVRRSNCIACHADAQTGLFAPQDIAIPSLTP